MRVGVGVELGAGFVSRCSWSTLRYLSCLRSFCVPLTRLVTVSSEPLACAISILKFEMRLSISRISRSTFSALGSAAISASGEGQGQMQGWG